MVFENKMRTLVVTLSLFCLSNSCHLYGQDFKYINPKLDDSCQVISIIQDTANFFERLVYIDHKKYSSKKDQNFDLNSDRLSEVFSTYERIVKNENLEINQLKIELPKYWIRLHRYKDQWTLYDDIEHNFRTILTDTSLISFAMDGVYSIIINKVDKSENKTTLSLTNRQWSNGQRLINYDVNIYVIEKERNITIWEYIQGDNSSYDVFIPYENRNLFPIVSIWTTDLMGDESEMFDEIDFKKLLKK